MKPALLFCIALFITSTLWAKNITVGANGGEVLTFVPIVNGQRESPTQFYLDPSLQQKAAFSTTGSLSVSYNYHKWQAGISVGLEKLYNRIKVTYKDQSPIITNPPTVTYSSGSPKNDYRIVIASSAIPIALFLNRQIKLSKDINMYFGIAGGDALWYYNDPNYYKNSWMANGYLAGMQIGAVYDFSEHFGVDLQAAYQHMWVKGNAYQEDFHIKVATMPFTVGVRYRL